MKQISVPSLILYVLLTHNCPAKTAADITTTATLTPCEISVQGSNTYTIWGEKTNIPGGGSDRSFVWFAEHYTGTPKRLATVDLSACRPDATATLNTTRNAYGRMGAALSGPDTRHLIQLGLTSTPTSFTDAHMENGATLDGGSTYYLWMLPASLSPTSVPLNAGTYTASVTVTVTFN